MAKVKFIFEDKSMITLTNGVYMYDTFKPHYYIEKICLYPGSEVVIYEQEKAHSKCIECKDKLVYSKSNKCQKRECSFAGVKINKDTIVVVKCVNDSCGFDEIMGDPSKIKWDYIIVGYGTAGGVLARFLSDPDKNGIYRNKVLMLEYGENHVNDPVITSSSPFSVTNQLTYDPKFSSAYPLVKYDDPTQASKNLPILPIYSEGRTWGGSSAHNGQQVVRGAPNTWNDIAAHAGNPIWSYDNAMLVT